MPKTPSTPPENPNPATPSTSGGPAAPTPVTPVNPGPVVGPVTPVVPPVPLPIPIPIPTPGPVGAPVTLTPSNPSTTTNAPTSSVAVTVPNTTGTVTFSLVVTDNLGVQSAPAFATVTIQGPPVAVLTATPATLAENGTIELTGAKSTSSGSIASYKFSLVPASAPPNA
ncbi:MAG TPA: hypothetical protein VF730_17360 [Terracidiphilus sp.]